MVYTKPLPELKDLCLLAHAVPSFPARTGEVIAIAKRMGYGSDVIDFLRLFPEDAYNGNFESRADFYTRTAELAMMICEENWLQPEGKLSPQD